MTNGNVNLGGSQSSFEEDEKAMKKGRGKMIAFAVAAAIFGIGGLGFFIMQDSGREPYEEFGRRLSGMHEDYFQKFWVCAFQGPAILEVKNNRDLTDQIIKRATAGRARYGAMVKDKCLATLDDMRPKIDATIPPAEMKGELAELGVASDALHSAWGDFIAVLEASPDGFDADANESKLNAIGKAWFDYKKALAGLEKKLAAKLNP